MAENEMTKLSADTCEQEVSMIQGQAKQCKKSVPGGKGRGVFCSLPTVILIALTVGVLMTAASLLAHYLPCRTPAPSVVIPLLRGRLPKTIQPRRYRVKLRPYLYDDDDVPDSGRRFTFDGWVRITVECVEPTDEITLHAKNLSLHGMPVVTSVGSVDQKTDILDSYEIVEEYAFMVLKLKRILSPHQEYDIYIEYSGILGDDEIGFYPSMYLDPMKNTRFIATTQLEGPFARLVFPCFDEPNFKATFDVQLEHRIDMQALSNGMETGRELLDSHWARTSFASVSFMPTYLLAFIVHDFSSINVTNDHGCLIRVWCQSDLINFAPFALNVSDMVQTYFDDYLDYRYPLTKQVRSSRRFPSPVRHRSPEDGQSIILTGTSSNPKDHVAIQDTALLGMENWGLITYLDESLLYGMDETFSIQSAFTSLIAHELAHQWFGNLVTMEWWDDVWLNEGFASYVSAIGVNRVHPELDQYVTFYVETINYGLWFDSLGSYPAVRAPVYATDEGIEAQISPIAYNKGASLLWMLEHVLTIEVFNRGMQSYLKERAYKNANAEHLWRELTEADRNDGMHDIKRIMDTWTLQRGYPLVTLARTGNDIEATQEIFLQYGQELQEDEYGNLGYKWYVPLTYMYKSGPSDQYDQPKSIWLEPANDKTTFSLPPGALTGDWYLANAKMVGFYRVNYDHTNWQRLLKQSEDDPNVFSQENRIGLLYDTAMLASSEVIDVEIYLAFVKSFENNTALIQRAVLHTLHTVAGIIEGGSNHSTTRRSSYPSAVQEYMQRIVEPLYVQYGWDPSFIPDLPMARRKKARIDITSTACRYGNQHCISQATNQFKEYMDNPNYNIIPENFRKVVYCYGLRFGGQLEWDFAVNMLLSDDRRERSRWISALSCSMDTHQLQSNLQLMLDSSSFTRRDSQLMLTSMAENPDGYEVAWDFLRHNWEDAEKIFKGNRQLLGEVLEEIASHFNTKEKLQELLELGRNRNLGALKNPYAAAIAATKVNVRWTLKNAGRMEDWMNAAIHDH